ncbi:hypothetical protein T12_10448 [Trichinella patagoniensis]|uniref:Uncharacterized protein n=1 Tax=Trichinella patagoniensis TaxID=990121 RepID=A0A0V0ZJU2_9BILA|nr:hypothetical protein T12_6033 [Trichinella patagoniensis]KRY12832.1 hypothetical protein T12_10448 [Trichinella patagoniensis]
MDVVQAGLSVEGLAFGFTTLNRWWKAGGRIAMRLCGGNVVRGYNSELVLEGYGDDGRIIALAIGWTSLHVRLHNSE